MLRPIIVAVAVAAALAFPPSALAQSVGAPSWLPLHVLVKDGDIGGALKHVTEGWLATQAAAIGDGRVLAYRIYAIDAADQPNRGLLVTVLTARPGSNGAATDPILTSGAPALSPDMRLREIGSWSAASATGARSDPPSQHSARFGRGLLNRDLAPQ